MRCAARIEQGFSPALKMLFPVAASAAEGQLFLRIAGAKARFICRACNAALKRCSTLLSYPLARSRRLTCFHTNTPCFPAPKEFTSMIVMKFGGTSVQDAKAIERAGAIVKGRIAQKPVVVVSAMAKVTDQLLAMARAAGAGDRKTALKLCRALQERHYNTAGELLGTALFTQFHGDLGADFETLEELLRGIAAVGELTPRTTDYVSAFGEMLSSKIVAAAFSAHGYAVGAGGLPRLAGDRQRPHARRPAVRRNEPAPADRKLRRWWLRAKFRSWEASSEPQRLGITTTIGRGGSDYSAAIAGAGLEAERIEIWTDVDGMMTTDPRMCPEARRIKVISFDEAAELAYFGAKVLHPATVLPAVQKNIPVYILNSQQSGL